MFSIIIVTFI